MKFSRLNPLLWFRHPWRRWNRPKAIHRLDNFVYFRWTSDDYTTHGTTDGRHLRWLIRHFPHTFAFPDRDLPFTEVRDWMDANAGDLWTMGYFHPGFAHQRVFIRDDDTAFAFRMRFKAIYQRSVDADEVRRTLNMAMGIIGHVSRTGSFKIRL